MEKEAYLYPRRMLVRDGRYKHRMGRHWKLAERNQQLMQR